MAPTITDLPSDETFACYRIIDTAMNEADIYDIRAQSTWAERMEIAVTVARKQSPAFPDPGFRLNHWAGKLSKA